jgi:ATP adenylyltransferase
LWAPWRIEYIAAPKSGCCFICDKARSGSDEANHVIGRGRTSFVLLNDFPYNSGHIMVAPYRHVADLTDLTSAELAEVLELVIRGERMLKQLMGPDGFNFGFNLGAAAGAGLREHVHGHLVPRWVGDTNFMPVLADTRVVPQALTDTTRLLRAAWGS